MANATNEQTALGAEEEALKVEKYKYLLPVASPEFQAKMRVPSSPDDDDSDATDSEATHESGALADNASAIPDAPSAAEIDALIPPVWDEIDAATARQKAIGCLLGLAIGDAVGAAVEFSPRDSFPPLTDMIGGGPFHLQPGEWTDDTTMALCLAESLLATEQFDQHDFMNRMRAWLEKGENTVPHKCFDIGATTRAAIESFIANGEPAAGTGGANTAGNGSLVRLAPLAIIGREDIDEAAMVSLQQTNTTHAAQQSIDSCKLFLAQLIDALNGADKEAVLRQRVMALCPPVLFISAGEFKQKTRAKIKSTGYVVHTLEAALWSVWNTGNFRDAVLTAANLGDDSDSVAAVAGQLAGALYGAGAIPAEWLAKLAWREKFEQLASALFDRSGEF